MGILKVDTTNEKLLEQPVYEPLEPGNYTFEVANDLKVEQAKSSDSKIVKIELRCTTTDYEGKVVWDNLVIMANKADRAKTEWKIAQFAVSCGVITESELKQLGEIDLAAFKGTVCEAQIAQEPYTDTNTGEKRLRNRVARYLFEPEDASEAAAAD